MRPEADGSFQSVSLQEVKSSSGWDSQFPSVTPSVGPGFASPGEGSNTSFAQVSQGDRPGCCGGADSSSVSWSVWAGPPPAIPAPVPSVSSVTVPLAGRIPDGYVAPPTPSREWWLSAGTKPDMPE